MTARINKEPVTTYSSVARGLLSPSMDENTKSRIMKKFDISFVIAKECLPFTKYSVMHELEERHGVDLGQAYKTCESAHKFVHYIAESQRQAMHSGCLSVKHFFSCLMDGSTDKGRVENELFVILYCHKDSNTEKVKTTVKFLSVVEPMKADADGLISCLNDALKPMGIDDILDSEGCLAVKGHPVLVGIGSDGATVNISAQNGVRGQIQNALPWLFWAWCYCHRLELACHDSLSSSLFKEIDEMLLRLYYLYEKSPKKCRELLDLVMI